MYFSAGWIWNGQNAQKCALPLISGRQLSLRSTLNVVLEFKTPVGRDGSVGIATYYRLNGLGIKSRWGTRFSAPIQTGSGAHSASFKMGTGSFPGSKRPELDVDHPSTFSAKGEERAELYLYSHFGPSWLVLCFMQNTYRQHSQAVLICTIRQKVLKKHKIYISFTGYQ